MLIWAASHRLAAQDFGPPTSRSSRFTPYKLLVAIGRATADREYQLFKGSITHLHSTVIRATIRHGRRWRPRQLSWITEGEELTTRSGF
jgi:plasmid replication initiation protein